MRVAGFIDEFDREHAVCEPLDRCADLPGNKTRTSGQILQDCNGVEQVAGSGKRHKTYPSGSTQQVTSVAPAKAAKRRSGH